MNKIHFDDYPSSFVHLRSSVLNKFVDKT